MNIEDLRRPFSDQFLDWRVQQAGERGGSVWALILCYVDARGVQERLDKVCGPLNWYDHYEFIGDKGVKCTIYIKNPDTGEWVGKQNGSPETQVEAFKGGFSKAFVRAAVNWGIGRYLYDLPATFAQVVTKNAQGTKKGSFKNKEGKYVTFYWKHPYLNGGVKPSWTQKPETN